LVSPALPVGGFSYSEGLESLVQQGRLGDAPTLRSWLEAELWRGCLTVEAATLPGLMVLLERARSADPLEAKAALQAVGERDGWLLAQREAPEVRAQQRQISLWIAGGSGLAPARCCPPPGLARCLGLGGSLPAA
jgi:urease accessory protein